MSELRQRNPWVVGLDSIKKQQLKYRYFWLTKDSSEEYYDAQQEIKAEIQKGLDKIKSQLLGKTNIQKQKEINQDLDEKREEALNKEEKLFSIINKNKEYQQKNFSIDYKSASDVERVNFWTSFLYDGNLSEDKKAININLSSLSNRQAFSIIIGSKNYDEIVKANSYSFFSRHGILKNGKNPISDMGQYISTKEGRESNDDLLEKIKEAFRDAASNATQGTIQWAVLNEIARASSVQSSSGYITAFAKVETYFNRKDAKHYTATRFSTNLREDIENYLKDPQVMKTYGINPDTTLKLTDSVGAVYLQVALGDSSENYFYQSQKYWQKQYSTQYISKLINIVYNKDPSFRKDKKLSRIKAKKEEELRNITDDLIKMIRREFRKSLERFPQNNSDGDVILDLLSLGKINLSKSDFLNILSKAKEYCKEGGEFEKFLCNQGKGKESLILRTFRTTNVNQFLSGIFGEIKNAISLGGKNFITARMTGTTLGDTNAKAQSSKNNGGYNSVNDVQFSYTGQGGVTQKYGVNIKHYIFSKNILPLYQKGNEISLNTKYIYKYFTEEQVDLMRWASNTQSFLDHLNQKANIEQLAYSLAFKNIDTFVRIEEADQKGTGTVQNLFFQLNNVLYPLSYIYAQIKDYLKDSSLFKMNDKNALFYTKTKKENMESIDEYLERRYFDHTEGILDVEKAANFFKTKEDYNEYNLINEVINTQRAGDITFLFKGVVINLLQMNLFVTA